MGGLKAGNLGLSSPSWGHAGGKPRVKSWSIFPKCEGRCLVQREKVPGLESLKLLTKHPRGASLTAEVKGYSPDEVRLASLPLSSPWGPAQFQPPVPLLVSRPRRPSASEHNFPASGTLPVLSHPVLENHENCLHCFSPNLISEH